MRNSLPTRKNWSNAPYKSPKASFRKTEEGALKRIRDKAQSKKLGAKKSRGFKVVVPRFSPSPPIAQSPVIQPPTSPIFVNGTDQYFRPVIKKLKDGSFSIQGAVLKDHEGNVICEGDFVFSGGSCRFPVTGDRPSGAQEILDRAIAVAEATFTSEIPHQKEQRKAARKVAREALNEMTDKLSPRAQEIIDRAIIVSPDTRQADLPGIACNPKDSDLPAPAPKPRGKQQVVNDPLTGKVQLDNRPSAPTATEPSSK